MEIIATEQTGFTEHELDEWYPGVITDAGDGDDYGFGPTFKITIQLDGEDSDTWALTSQTLNPATKLWRWVEAIDRTLLPEFGQAFQYKKLVGRRVEVMFEQGTSRVNVGKIRAEKKAAAKTGNPVKVSATSLQAQQKAAAAAKKPVEGDDSPF